VTISIDAIGCRREIADKIVECGADFILSAKDNQSCLARAPQALDVRLHRPVNGGLQVATVM
jgi:predicted transposase YbfD/YdcC